jgi:hypothetical protein
MKIFIVIALFVVNSVFVLGDDVIPKSKEEAVIVLKTKWLSNKDLQWILMNPLDDVLARLHLPFGTGVRNEWKLWGGGNPELMKSCGSFDPEECSSIIFEELWESVRKDADSNYVHRLDKQFNLFNSIRIKYKGFNNSKIGLVIGSIQKQIDNQTLLGDSLKIKLIGNPNLECYTRAEFSEDQRDPISLSLLMGWISWRNGFDVKHSPPYLEFIFNKPCSWSDPPDFKPATAPK